MVYPPECITKIESSVEFPLVNGEPDKKHGRMVRPVVTLDFSCIHSHIEIRKDSNAVETPSNP